jgi:CRP/FNR family transcriptional regulator
MDDLEKKYKSAKRSELFKGLPSFVSKEVLSSAHCRDFAAGEFIYFAGDPMKQLLLLTDGRVKKSHLIESGGEVIIRLTVPGEVISDPAWAPGTSHASTAQALQDCKVLAWESATFGAALEYFPGLRRNAKRILARRLAELERRFCEISNGTASPRLANSLVHLADRIGHIEIGVSQEALGQMTAMTSTSVCRLLNTWKGQGLVKLRKKTIEIHSVPRLVCLSRSR